jgi:hypothetical protein
MNDARYVYKEVNGRDLERATIDGWEYVSGGAGIGAFGPIGFYLVRRPAEKPDAMKLAEEKQELATKLDAASATANKLKLERTTARAAAKAAAERACSSGRNKPSREDLVRMIRDLRDTLGYYD